MYRPSKFTLLALVLASILAASPQAHAAKNIIIMISDGASFGIWDMAALYSNGTAASSSYYGAGFSKYLMTTYPLNTSNTPTGNITPTVGYNPAKAWGLESYKNGSASYLHQNYVDSAAAGTAMSTGEKTYNNAMKWSNMDAPITPTLPELAKVNGKVVGTISTVQWSHATPAAFSDAHDISRNNYSAIANDMLNGNVMDVIMGAGNPNYTDNGTLKTSGQNYSYVGGQTVWNDLNAGTHANGWKSIQSKTSFEALAAGDLSVLDGKTRLVATAEVGGTLQQGRTGYSHADPVFSDAPNTNVPSLKTMTLASLNVLKSLDNGNGIFLLIEGGAVDWAAHANQTSRMVEEQIDFNNAVDAVTKWIEAHGGWGENLLLITTDHGNSMPSGESSGSIAHELISLENIQAGTYTSSSNTNGVRWWSGNHTNELVPLFARGAGSELFEALIDGNDFNFSTYYPLWAATGFDGNYVDHTDVFTVFKGAAVPEFGSMLLFGSGIPGLAALSTAEPNRPRP